MRNLPQSYHRCDIMTQYIYAVVITNFTDPRTDGLPHPARYETMFFTLSRADAIQKMQDMVIPDDIDLTNGGKTPYLHHPGDKIEASIVTFQPTRKDGIILYRPIKDCCVRGWTEPIAVYGATCVDSVPKQSQQHDIPDLVCQCLVGEDQYFIGSDMVLISTSYASRNMVSVGNSDDAIYYQCVQPITMDEDITINWTS